MLIIDSKCWKCDKEMKCAIIVEKEDRIEYTSPKYFTEEQINFAKTKGVTLLLQHSKTAEESYIANTCIHCSSFVGEHFLPTNVLCDVLYNLTTYKAYDII